MHLKSVESLRKPAGFKPLATGVILFCWAVVMTPGAADAGEAADVPARYEPTWESLEKHPVPNWFKDAKFGIFIHWGVYSVPGWAPKGKYAEWYPRNMYREGSPTNKYHKEHYGDPKEFTYNDFIPMFKAEKWDPDDWADLFVRAGARYVVPTGEHHDGFPLWDSDLTEWDAADMGPKRDLIGDLGRACRERGMKYAPSYHRMLNYYSPPYGGGAFGNPHYSPKGPDKVFVAEWKARWEELRDKYRPDIMWWDGDWTTPETVWGSRQIVADYYNVAKTWGKEVVVNDRLGKLRGKRGDFYTQEYQYGIRSEDIIPHCWESCRGIGHSFGYNRQEGPEDYASSQKLIEMLVDIVSKNGNLLLDIGPRADGTIPEIQRQRLEDMGRWLDVNGPAIYGTRSWRVFGEGKSIRFTRKGRALYVIHFQWPGKSVTIKSLAEGSKLCDRAIDDIRLLGAAGALKWTRDASGLTVQLPEKQPCKHAVTFEIKFK